MLNRVVLIGRLTRDPEMRYTPSGIPSTKIGLAVQRSFTNAQGEREVDFVDVVAWRKQAETAAQYLKKGRLVAIDGRLATRTYETQDGQKRKVYEVIADQVRFLDSAKDGQHDGGGDSAGADEPYPEGAPDAAEEPVPF